MSTPSTIDTKAATSASDWARSDEYHNSFLLSDDVVLRQALSNSDAGGLPRIAVSPAQGKYLTLLAKSLQARRILEVGVLGG